MIQPLFFLSLKQISVYLDVYQMVWRARVSYQKHVACTLECCHVYRAVGAEPDCGISQLDCHHWPCVLFFFMEKVQ